MANIKVGLLGRKGGTGKTTTTHLLARGVALSSTAESPKASIVITTDDREVMPDEPEIRGYHSWDGRTAEKLLECLSRADELGKQGDVWTFIDGGATRQGGIDAQLRKLCDIVLIPTLPGYDDLRVIQEDVPNFTAEEMGKTFFIPVRFSANRFAAKVELTRLRDELPGARLFCWIPDQRRTDMLLQNPMISAIPNKVEETARYAAQFLLSLTGHAEQPVGRDYWKLIDGEAPVAAGAAGDE